MSLIRKFIGISVVSLVTACGSQNIDQEMYYLGSALTKVSAAVDATVRYRRPAENMSEAELLQLSTAHDPALLKPFDGLTVRVQREGRDSAVLVCEAQKGRALLEDAGCTAKLDQHRWSSGMVEQCEFTLDVKKVCIQ